MDESEYKKIAARAHWGLAISGREVFFTEPHETLGPRQKSIRFDDPYTAELVYFACLDFYARYKPGTDTPPTPSEEE